MNWKPANWRDSGTASTRNSVRFHPKWIFLAVPRSFLIRTTRGLKIVRAFGLNLLSICRKVWRPCRGTEIATFIRRDLLPRVLAATTAREEKLRHHLSSNFCCDTQDLQIALNYFDGEILNLKEELKNEYEIDAIKFAKKESRTFSASPATASPTEHGSETATRRKSIIMALLERNGLSVHDWANRAKVDFHTARNYLNGKATPYPSTLKKLALPLGIEVEKLPK